MIKARATDLSRQVQRFKVPTEPNFDAVEYFDMIDRALCPISEPPVTKAMKDAERSGVFREGIGPCPLFVPNKFVDIGKKMENLVCPILRIVWSLVASKNLPSPFMKF